MERVEIWDPTIDDYCPPTPSVPVLTAQAAPPPSCEASPPGVRRRSTGQMFRPAEDDPALATVTPAARPLLLQWWNESRWSKHRSKATWTSAAWVASVARVAQLPPDRQLELARSGVECGWQALKWEFMGQSLRSAPAVPVSEGRLMPQDPRMLEALRLEHEAESWLAV